jgi:hypothetical protein
MEFLDINVTKKLESFALCYSQSLLLADFSTLLLNIRETRKLESIHEKHFVERKMRVENSSLRRLENVQKPRLKMPFKNSISVQTDIIRGWRILYLAIIYCFNPASC